MSLRLDQDRYHEFYDEMDGGICIIQADESEQILFVNRTVPELYGCRDEAEFYERTGGTFAGMTKESDREPLSLHVVRGARYSTWYYQIPEAGGAIRPAQMLITCAVRENTPVYLCQIFTEAMHKASLMSDGLTGLPGVKEFTASSLDLLRTKRGEKTLGDWCCLYFNITNFRSFNRAYGVETGDRFIKRIAETLQACFPDGFIGHLSADNFAAIVRRTEANAGIRRVTEEIQGGIRSKSIQLKTGIYLPEEGADDDTLKAALDRARLACDSISQDATQDAAVYSSRMQEESEKRTYLLNHFESALAQGDIHVYYQPVVRTLTGKLCGFEALARWEDPEKGMISPAEFVPLLEEVRLIGKLDAYIIENVCRLLHERLQNGHQILPVSVNLSKLDFELIHPLELLVSLMDRYDLPRESIHVEITETVMAWDREKLVGIIRDFHAAGFEVWLDDFGSEYSSLNALHYFQFDVLKIDMEFFRNFDERGRKIIRSVVMMAKSLGILTLAEGVENAQQLEFLKSVDCGRIQGWYYGKPEPFSVVMERMTRRGITSETTMERRIFSRVGLVNTVTEKSVAIFRFDGKIPTLLTANEVYLNVLRATGTLDQKMANGNLASGAWGPQKKICSFLQKVFDGRAKSMTYVDNGHYIMVSAEKIAGTREQWYGKASLVDIGEEGNVSKARLLDNLYRNVLDIFDGVYYMDYTHNCIHTYSSIHGEIPTDIDAPRGGEPDPGLCTGTGPCGGPGAVSRLSEPGPPLRGGTGLRQIGGDGPVSRVPGGRPLPLDGLPRDCVLQAPLSGCAPSGAGGHLGAGTEQAGALSDLCLYLFGVGRREDLLRCGERKRLRALQRPAAQQGAQVLLGGQDRRGTGHLGCFCLLQRNDAGGGTGQDRKVCPLLSGHPPAGGAGAGGTADWKRAHRPLLGHPGGGDSPGEVDRHPLLFGE